MANLKCKSMTPKEIEDFIELCGNIAKDVENDAKEFDGKPFTGKTMAEYMGYHGAAIKALSHVIEQVLNHLKTLTSNQ